MKPARISLASAWEPGSPVETSASKYDHVDVECWCSWTGFTVVGTVVLVGFGCFVGSGTSDDLVAKGGLVVGLYLVVGLCLVGV